MKSTNFPFHRDINQSRRSGFTLVEVLVCITIIGLLVALLIPAVQSARETARRTNCVSNMRQIGLAMSSYHSSVGVFPSSNNANRGFSPFVMILPNFELSSLYNSINFGLYFFDTSNSTASDTKISMFLCPSDSFDPHYGAWTNYACNTGYGYQVYGKFNGAFSQAPQLSTISGITDGTSSTAMMAEWVKGSGVIFHQFDKLGSSLPTPGRIGPDQFDLAVSNCANQVLDTSISYSSNKGALWIQTGLSLTLYNHNITVNGFSCTNGSNVMEGCWTASSRHPGGANLLFVDGHVQFIRQTISLQTWRSLGTRAGSEVISGSEY